MNRRAFLWSLVAGTVLATLGGVARRVAGPVEYDILIVGGPFTDPRAWLQIGDGENIEMERQVDGLWATREPM